MPDSSPKMGLSLPRQVDGFSTADLRANWEKIDAAPGTLICTSATRPSWTTGHEGRRIYETDTDLEWVWNGTEFRRLGGGGLLKTSAGAWAIAERNTNLSTTNDNFVRVVTLTSVVVPDGRRPLRVDLSWMKAANSSGNFSGAIFRSATNNSGPIMAQWVFGTAGSDANAGGGTFFAIERNGLAAGTYDFSFQIRAATGTSIISASSSTPTILAVSEM